MKETDKNIITNRKLEDEIDLFEIVSKLWTKRRFIIKTTAIFAIIGLLIAIFTPNEYTASTTMVPQTGEKSSGGKLNGLAAMAGINLVSMNSGEVLSPSVYPKILKNINFQKELIYSKYNFNKTLKPISYYEYFTNKKYATFNLLSIFRKYTIGLPMIIVNSIKSEPKKKSIIVSNESISIDKLTKEESEIINNVFSNLSFELNEKEGYITLSYISREPTLSAEVVFVAQKLLQKYITEFKIEKVRSNLDFVMKSYDEAKINVEKKQDELANYRDANKSLSSALARTHEEKLTSEYNLLLSIFTELAKQKEQAKIALTETTPIFTIIQPVIVPEKKSGPDRIAIILILAFTGLIFSSLWVYLYPYIKKIFISNYSV